MASVRKPSVNNDSSQWSSDTTMPDSFGGIPSAWLKAEAALQQVQQTKKESSGSTSSTAASVQSATNPANVYNYSYSYWAQMYGGYPGYSTMPGYNYYNMGYPNVAAYNTYYGYPAMAAAVPSTVVSNNLVPLSSSTTSSDTASVPEAAENVALKELANKPPPPPPIPPPNSEGSKPTFNKLAPRSGGIRFTMPKRNAPKVSNLLNLAKRKFQNEKAGPNNSQNSSSIEHFSPAKSFTTDNKDSDNEALEHLGFNVRETDTWPPSLKEYLRRCYSNCTTKIQKDRMAIILKGKLGQLLKNGNLWSKDWASEPLLSLCSGGPNKEHEGSSGREKRSRFSNSLPKHSPSKAKNYRTPSRFQSRSRSRSKSRSLSPYPRRVVRKREDSSGSSSSSSTDHSSRKQSLCSSIVTPIDHHTSKQNNSHSSKKKKNKKKVMSFVVDPEEFAENQVRLQRRAARFQPAVGKKGGSIVLTVNNFQAVGIDEDETDIDWSRFAIIGTCEDMEKPFLRITSAVDPSSIRPQNVLEKSLMMVKQHWKKHHDYFYVCEQLKSIRQDLVVQCIRNSFTIQAYETHARIALEKGDRTEFNQCQSQLKVLYEELNEGNQEEFLAYRILYNMHTNDTRELKNIISSLSPEEKKKDMIKYALSLNLAWTLNNFHKFFKLYVAAPKMAGFIIDWFVASVRKAALKAFVKSYRPTIPVAFLERELEFSSPQECRSFLDEYCSVYSDDKSCLSCKESQASILA